MKFPIKIEYASCAVLELALHWPNSKPLSIDAIAQRQKIPAKFLTQILLELKKMGVAQSVRGQMGGYLLTRAPQEIQLKTVIEYYFPLASTQSNLNKSKFLNIFEQIWNEMDQMIKEYLEKITFEDLKNKELNSRVAPSYAI